MRNLVCITHPKYCGDGAPVLSCKTCCGIYIAAIKELQISQPMPSSSQSNFDARQWIEEKAQILIDKQNQKKPSVKKEALAKIDFHPGII